MMAKKIYLLSWSGYGFPEWNIITDDEEKAKILEEINEHGWVRPDIYQLTVEDLQNYIELCGRLGVCGLDPETIREEILKLFR